MALTITVNGVAKNVDVDPETPLLWVLRETLGLTGTKFGCGIAACGACTVHVDGVAERSCSIPVKYVDGRAITTIEGLTSQAHGEAMHPVEAAWIAEDVPQCGYCQSGMIMAAAALLKDIPKPTDDDINTYITNICRCGTYNRVRRAIKRAATSA